MKLLMLTFALIGCVVAISVPDSATQGPNPQDIATPEPEYIDIDDEPPPAPAPAPVVQQRSSFVAAPAPRPVARPIVQAPPLVSASIQSFARAPSSAYLAPHRFSAPAQLASHSFSHQSGYQYRRPVYVRRRVYRRRF